MTILEPILGIVNQLRHPIEFVRLHYVTAISTLIGGLLVWQVTTSEIAFDPIDVGEGISKDIGGAALSLRIIDRIRELSGGSIDNEFTADKKRNFRLTGQEIEIEMPGGGTTLQTVLRSVRHILGTEHLIISGELRIENDRFVLRLRSNKPDHFPALRVDAEVTSVDKLVDLGAWAILGHLEPLATALELIGSDKGDDAIAFLRRGLRGTSPRTAAKAAAGLGYFAYLDGRPGEGQAMARMALDLDPNSVIALQLACDLEHDAGRHSNAIAHCGKAVAIDPRATNGYAVWASSLLALEDVEAAIAKLSEGIERSRTPVYLYAQLGIALEKRNRHRDIATIGKRYAARMPGEAGFHRILGLALVRQGDVESGIGHIMAGIDLARPNKAQMAYGYVRLGHAYLSDGKRDLARAQFERGLELDPTNESAKRELAALNSAIRPTQKINRVPATR